MSDSESKMPLSIRMERQDEVVRFALPNHFMKRPPFEAILELAALGYILWWSISRIIAVWPLLEKWSMADSVLLSSICIAAVCLMAVAYLVRGLIARDELEVQPEEIRYWRRRRVLSDLAAWLLVDILLILITVQGHILALIVFSYEDGPVRRSWMPWPRGSYTYILRSTVEKFCQNAKYQRGTVMTEACLPATAFSTVDEMTGPTKIELGRALSRDERGWLLDYLSSWQTGTDDSDA